MCVAEHRLDRTKVCSIFKKVGGKTMAENVRCNLFPDPCSHGVSAHDALDTPRRKGGINAFFVLVSRTRHTHKERISHVFSSRKICPEGILRACGKKNHPHFLPLTA